MSDAKHIPGPWHIKTVADAANKRRVYGADDVEITDGTRGGTICTLYRFNHGGPGPLGAVDAANARLLAAAPDLLTALDDLIRAAGAMLDCTDGSEREYLRDEARKARAAVAKVEGRS